MNTEDKRAVCMEGAEFGYPPSGRLVLKIDRFEVEAKEKVFLYGPSGSGKTTFLGLLSGILKPTSGRVSLLGTDLAQLGGHQVDRYRGAHVGYIFQMFNLLPYLNVIDNVCLPCKVSPQRKSRLTYEMKEEARVLMGRLGLESFELRKVTDLSVGQQQRVAAARALMGAPEMIIADEPTSSLDADHRGAFIDLLFEEADRIGSTVIFVSHDGSLRSKFSRSVSLADINRVSYHAGI